MLPICDGVIGACVVRRRWRSGGRSCSCYSARLRAWRLRRRTPWLARPCSARWRTPAPARRRARALFKPEVWF